MTSSNFKVWFDCANSIVEENLYVGIDDLPELPGFFWHDHFEDGLTPSEAARIFCEHYWAENEMYF